MWRAQSSFLPPAPRLLLQEGHDSHRWRVDGTWDYYNLLATVPGDTAYPTAADSGCPLTK